MKPGWIIFIALIFILAIFILQNNQIVTYHFFFWQISISQLVLLPLTALIGFVIGFATGKLAKR